MLKGITHVTRHVRDADEALTFYRDLLGFEVHTDQQLAPGQRWLTVRLPAQPDLELVLLDASRWLGGDARDRALAALDVQPTLTLSTTDIDALHERLRLAGARLDMPEVGQQPWGRDLAFRDPGGAPVYVVESVPVPA